MIPTIQNVKDECRRHLSDSEVSGGQVFTDTKLQPYVARAYAEMLRVLDEYGVQLVQRNLFYVLPANQTVFYPSQAGHANFGEPKAVRTRLPKTTVAISNAVPDAANSLCTITSAANDFVTGDSVVIYGVQGVSFDINDEWTINVNSTTEFELLGCLATGTHSAATDFASSSDDEWSDPLDFIASLADLRRLGKDGDEAVVWERDRFLFNLSSQARQIMVEYTLSGNLSVEETATPDTDSVGVDDSLDFLSHRAAGFAAHAFGNVTKAALLANLAIGSQRELDSGYPGGYLGNMVRRGVKALQKESYETQRFRPKRTAGRIPQLINY